MGKTIANPLDDLIRAFSSLQPDEEASQAIAALLGRGWAEGNEAPVAQPADGPSRASVPVGTSTAGHNLNFSPLTVSRGKEKIPSELTRLANSTPSAPAWLSETKLLAEPTTSPPVKPGALEPLFRPNWTRHILSGALATRSEEGRLEMEIVISSIARAEPLTALPRRPRPTLARGAQLLIDQAEAMEPFFGDQARLRTSIIKVVGRDRTQMLAFAGCPLWGAGSGLRDEWEEYRPPPQGTPVLLLTDLGIGRPPIATERASAGEWLEFATRLCRAGCPVVAFVPYAAARWPEKLRRVMTILQWDRTTTVAVVKRLVGDGLRVAGGGR